MVGRRVAAEHQNAKGQSRLRDGHIFRWLIRGKSRPTARFYKKKSLALSQGLILERKFSNLYLRNLQKTTQLYG
jgi:hypothetical protein